MPHIIEITDPHLPEAEIFRSSDAQLRSKQHPHNATFMAESGKVVGYAMDAGIEPIAFMMERKHITGQARAVLSRVDDSVPVYTGDREILREIVGYHPDRCIQCVMRRPAERDAAEICRDTKRIAVIEAVTDTTNLGAVFRSAAALGMDAILLTPTCCDPLNRRCVRVSMGTVFQVPWARIGNDPTDWPGKGMQLLHDMGFATAALALTDNSVSIDDPILAGEERLALVLGTEGDGLTKDTLADCDYTVKIPMSHGVDSLNVAAAGAVAFWQLGRRTKA